MLHTVTNGVAPRTIGKLILFVCDPPTQADVEAENAIRQFDPSVEIRSLGRASDVTTPRLDATEYNRSIYRGVDSILGFVKMERAAAHSQ